MARACASSTGPAAASNDYKRPSSRKVIPSTRPRNQAAIAASRASLYGNFAKSTDQVNAARELSRQITMATRYAAPSETRA